MDSNERWEAAVALALAALSAVASYGLGYAKGYTTCADKIVVRELPAPLDDEPWVEGHHPMPKDGAVRDE